MSKEYTDRELLEKLRQYPARKFVVELQNQIPVFYFQVPLCFIPELHPISPSAYSILSLYPHTPVDRLETLL